MMRTVWLVLLATVAATQTGCRLFERWQKDKDRPPAEPASRTRDPDWLKDRNRKDDSPYELNRDRPKRDGSLLDPPTVPASGVRPPAAGSWDQPTARNFDLRKAADGLISGQVTTADGQVVEGAFVAIENADPTKNTPGAEVGAQTDRNGLFLIQGLKSGESMVLTAKVRGAVAKQYVTVPNQRVRLQLRDDFAVPPQTTPTVPPPDGGVPAPKLFDGPKAGDELPFPAGDGGYSPVPSRPDLIAPGPDNRRPSPPAAIPGPGSAPPLLPVVPPSNTGTSRSIDRTFEFTLLDEDGKERTFPTGRPGDLIVLDFASTNCVHCAKAIPALTKLHDVHRDHAVEVVTVLCDPGSARDRLSAAEQYRKRYRFPYSLAVEAKAGAVQDAFGVKAYPSLVLLDGTGRKLWSGHPKQIDQLDKTIREAIASRADR